MQTIFSISIMSMIIVLASACRPSSQDNFLYDTASEQVQIKVSDQSNRVTLRGPTGKKITKLKEISTTIERTGKFAPTSDKKYVSLFTSGEKPSYSIEIIMGTDTSCKNASTAVVTLNHGSTFNVGCVSENALATQLKTACKELATDTTIAEYDASKDFCTCLKRTNKTLKYSEYLGKVSSFISDCKNLPGGTNPVDSNLTPAQLTDKFETACKKVGTVSGTSEFTKSCKCGNGLAVGLADWKKNQNTLESTCTEPLEPEGPETGSGSASGSLSDFEKDCKGNNGVFDLMKNTEDSFCTCKNPDGNVNDNEVTFREYQLGGARAIKDLCNI